MKRLALLLLVVACGHKDHDAGKGSGQNSGSSAMPPGHPIIVDAPPAPPVDWEACNTALRKAATEPLDVRPSLVIDNCKVCGDWTPILMWAHAPTEKGAPTHAQIEAAMATCGYCPNPNGKQRFMATLDNARGTDARTPWRYLGEQCKADISALPDPRFVSAPFYALDRIARAATAHGGESANLMAAIEFPLPAVSISGTGITLADVDGGQSQTASPYAITLIGDGAHVAKLPRARLGANGVTTDLGGYPGDVVKPADLGAAMAKLVAGDASASITILAPFATPAVTLKPIIASVNAAPIYLAVNAAGSPEGWALPATIPVQLVDKGGDILKVPNEMTVQQLATELAARARKGSKKITLQ
ncbi:MAG TPA: hypothetical protein VGC41_17665 [Kofleriaceae bacterium]